MQTAIFIILGVVVGIVITQILLRKKAEAPVVQDDTGFKLLLQQMNELTRTVDSKLGESAKEMHSAMRHQASESTKIIQEVTEKLTLLDVTNKQVVGFTEQLEELQDILKNPKQRGILGEYYLEALLKNILPAGTASLTARSSTRQYSSKTKSFPSTQNSHLRITIVSPPKKIHFAKLNTKKFS